MKKAITAIAILSSAFIITNDVITKLSMDEQIVHAAVVNLAMDYDATMDLASLSNNGSTYSIKVNAAAKALLAGDRTVAVQQFGNYLKAYISSAAFKNDFAKALGNMPVLKDSSFYQKQYDSIVKLANNSFETAKKQMAKPLPGGDPSKLAAGVDKNIQMALDMIEKNPQLLAQSGMTKEQFIAQMNGGKAAMVQAKPALDKASKAKDSASKLAMAQLPDILKDMEVEKNETIANAKTQRNEAWQNIPTDRERYTEEIVLYNKKKDYKTNLKKALQNFLAQTANIDFAAALTPNKRFVNNAYEAKSNIWKACYRAGIQATQSARAFAQQWITELK
jgi:hypothetical protein